MKNTLIQNNCANAPDQNDYAPGRFEERPYSFTASVLVALLEGKELTARYTGYCTRLGDAVSLLRASGWQIDIRDLVIDVYAGRPARFKTYSLNAEQIARARENGADSWRRMVKLAHDLKDSKISDVEVDILLAMQKHLRRELLRRQLLRKQQLRSKECP